MHHLLIINPNTTADVTRRMVDAMTPLLGPSVAVSAVTARFGADFIACEAAYSIAAHAAIDAWATHGGPLDGVLLGCFGDPGVEALRELSPAPVTGLAEAAMRAAAGRGRFAIVTGGPRWPAMLERLARQLGLDSALQRVHCVERNGGQLAADPVAAIELLTDACRQASRGGQVDTVILGGAALAGLAEHVAPRLDVPLLDNVACGARAIVELMRAGPGRSPGPDGARYSGLSAELTARLRSEPGSAAAARA